MPHSPLSRRRAAGARGARLALPLALACGALAGCETMKTAVDQAARVIAQAAPPPAPAGAAPAVGATARPVSSAPAAPAAVRNGIRGTELDDLFKKNPVTNTNSPQVWPRVAITVKSATPGVFRLSGAGSLTADDCVTFDIRLWTSASAGKRFDNLQLCVEAVEKEAKGVAFRTLDLLPRYTVHRSMNSTAAQRTDGPNPPFHVFPQDIRSMQGWPMGQTNARFFLGAIFLSLGWDWDNDFDRRLWVVSVPLPPAGY